VSKKQAIIIQIASFIPMVYTLLNLLPFMKNILSIEVIKDAHYFPFLILLITLGIVYTGYVCFEIFRYKKKTYKDYIWIIVLYIGFFYILPLYWYINVLRTFKEDDYFYVYRSKENIQPKLNEKEQ
jgi:hypothetical protein